MSYKPMERRVAIVTGGSGGIGKAISLRMADAGANVIICSRSAERGKKVVQEIKAGGGNADFFRTDLSKSKDIETMIAGVIGKHERVDILVNNAAVSGFMGPVADTPMEELETVLKVNLISIFYLCKLVLPTMIDNHFGRIINISSVAPRKSPANSATYNISKAGLNTLTQTLSKEVASYGITVNAIAPGLVLTERIIKSRLPGLAEKFGTTPEQLLEQFTADTDTKRLTKEEDVAELVMFLASMASNNITGEIVNIAGGF